MDQKHRLYSCLSEKYSKLNSYLSNEQIQVIKQLEIEIFETLLYSEGELNEHFKKDKIFVLRYFRLYTLPILEASNLLRFKCIEEALFWSKVQICFSLNCRYTDFLLDNDKEDINLTLILKKSQDYLNYAIYLVTQKGLSWSPEQIAIFNQFYEFDLEIKNKFVHDFDTFWRRVSPLCIVCKTYLKEFINDENFIYKYEQYLGCLLLDSDIDDFSKDLTNKVVTPVTLLVLESSTSNHKELGMYNISMNNIKSFLKWKIKMLLKSCNNLDLVIRLFANETIRLYSK